MKLRPAFISTALFGLALVTLPGAARAGLGRDESSIEQDRQSLGHRGIRHGRTAKSSYAVQEIANGRVTVREYIANGKVFALTWTGATQPNLQSLLGDYFEDFKIALQATPRRKGQRAFGRVQGREVLVERSGHMRWVNGRAYAPSLLPQGVTLDEIK